MTQKHPVFNRINRNFTFPGVWLILANLLFLLACSPTEKTSKPAAFGLVHTILNDKEKLVEPFGIASRNGEMFVSDGETGKIWRVTNNSNFALVTDKFHTPSAIVFDSHGDLIVADSGTHTIKRVKIENGAIESVAGVENQKGFADGDANAALFNAPIGIAVLENKIYVADTYNDKIRVIENGKVSTIAGSEQGYAEAQNGIASKFDTPCGLAIWKNKLLVVDTGNRRLRVVEPDGKTWTLAGNGADDPNDGLLFEANFIEPTSITVDSRGIIYVADGNAIRAIGRNFFPFVETLNNPKRGFQDGKMWGARFNRPSSLTTDAAGNLFVADAENQAIRVFTNGEISSPIFPEQEQQIRGSAAEFRAASEPRWTYNPPDAKREIAGTLGEIRGEIVDQKSRVWFHNGLDIVGGFGETARFIRAEKVLNPLATENFATLRELIRMPTIGYIHISLGRDSSERIFDDARFQFSRGADGKLSGVRVPRGTKFAAGDAVGTLNPMNHVHLIAGRAGREMNALDALDFPGVSDRITPTIEKISLFDENWQLIGETLTNGKRINLSGKTRIVARAFDRMDGNAERRRLGVYKIGYQVLRSDSSPVSDVNWTISFERNPDSDAVKTVYAPGSKSGATGETIFNYIASNRVNGDEFREDFFDAGKLETGEYTLRVFAADFFGNTTSQDIKFTR